MIPYVFKVETDDGNKTVRNRGKARVGNCELASILCYQSSSELSGNLFKSGFSDNRIELELELELVLDSDSELPAWRAACKASTLAPTSVAFLRIEAAETSRRSSSWKINSGKLRRAEGPRR